MNSFRSEWVPSAASKRSRSCPGGSVANLPSEQAVASGLVARVRGGGGRREKAGKCRVLTYLPGYLSTVQILC